MDETLQIEVASLRAIADSLEAKVDELFMRPRMPYTQGAISGDILELDSNLQPQWVAP